MKHPCALLREETLEDRARRLDHIRRHEEGARRIVAEGQSFEGPHRIHVVGMPDRHSHLTSLDAPPQGFELVRAPDAIHLEFGSRRCGRKILEQRAEVEFAEELPQALRIGFFQLELLQIQGQRKIPIDRQEFATPSDAVGVFLQTGPITLARHRIALLEQRVQAPKFGDQRARSLLPDSGCARNVVGSISDQTEDVHDSVRLDAPLFPNPGRIEESIAAGIEHRDPAVDELEEIFVDADDDDLQAVLLLGQRAERCDDVVCFIPLIAEHGDLHGFAQPQDVRDLLGQVLRHLRAVSLVLLELLVAHGWTGAVESHGEVIRRLVLHELAQHGGEAVHRIRGETLSVGQTLNRVVRTIDMRHPVDQEKSCHDIGC